MIKLSYNASLKTEVRKQEMQEMRDVLSTRCEYSANWSN